MKVGWDAGDGNVVIDFAPESDWNDTMMVVEKMRSNYAIEISLPKNGMDEKRTQVSVFTTKHWERPKDLVCTSCKYKSPLFIVKDKDPQKSILLAALKCYE